MDSPKSISIQSRMRDDWDSRIDHDYRYWMSDGVSSDQDMWETGVRDLEILLDGLDKSTLASSILLEVGCGVGRIVNAASKVFSEVVGIDVSEKAIEKANSLNTNTNVRFILGEGSNLSQLSDDSIDFAISFASLGSVPTDILISYLIELSRVVKESGKIRIQVYLGEEQSIAREDTLALRSYNVDRLIGALDKAGFEANYIKEVTLPFEVSDYENGVIAFIIGGNRNNKKSASFEDIKSTLLEHPERSEGDDWKGSKSAHLVALARVKQHLELNQIEKAEQAFTVAMKEYEGFTDESRAIYEELEAAKKNQSLDNVALETEVFEECEKYNGIILSHATDPIKAGNGWAERTLNSIPKGTKRLVVLGLGDGIFINQLRSKYAGAISVVETDQYIIKRYKSTLDNSIEFIFDYDGLEIELQKDSVYSITIPALPFYNRELVDKAKSISTRNKYGAQLDPRIAIVGPFFGGTLPIAGYIKKALLELNKEAHFIDLSPYSNIFSAFSNVLNKKSRQSEMESSYVELISNLVLNIVEEKNLDIVISVAQAPLSASVLEKLREKGVVTVHWFMEDTRRFLGWKHLAKYYDYFYLIQKDESIEEVLSAGGNRVRYLPLGCDIDIHRPLRVSLEEKKEFGSQVSFVGAGYNNRRHVFSKFSDLDFKIWGTEWPNVAPFDKIVQRQGSRISVDDYIKIFSSSEINLNLHSSQERDGVDPSGDFVNPRVFELAACGAFQLSDNRTLLPELFTIGSEIITFSDEREIRDLIKYYLENPEERQTICQRARERALKDHTYASRLKEMLNQIYADYGDHLLKRNDTSVWQKTIKRSEKYPELKSKLEELKLNKKEPQLEELVSPLIEGNSILTEFEQKLLFMHHMKGQITQIQRLRNE